MRTTLESHPSNITTVRSWIRRNQANLFNALQEEGDLLNGGRGWTWSPAGEEKSLPFTGYKMCGSASSLLAYALLNQFGSDSFRAWIVFADIRIPYYTLPDTGNSERKEKITHYWTRFQIGDEIYFADPTYAQTNLTMPSIVVDSLNKECLYYDINDDIDTGLLPKLEDLSKKHPYKKLLENLVD